MAVYVFPCLRIYERQMVRPNSYNGAILIVQPLRPHELHARGMLVTPWQRRCSLDERSRELS